MLNTDKLDDIKTAIVISDYQTNDVLYLNPYARKTMKIQGRPGAHKSFELLFGDAFLRESYLAAALDGGACWTKLLASFGRCDAPAVLHSVLLTDDGRQVRFDTVSPLIADDDNSDSLYTSLFESAYMRIESSYHGIDMPEENIYDCLSTSLDLYQADRAFILELDEELEACQYMYSKTREGIAPDSGENQPDDAMLFSNLFTGIIKKGEPFMFVTEQLKDTHPAEYSWLCAHRIFNAMAVPFTTRTELVAFFGVSNVRRFWNKTSFLTLSTKALANEIRAMRMMQMKSAAKHNSPELSDDDVVIKLFGGFEINTNIGSLDFTDLSSVQCGLFLLYLLKNRSRTIPIREIAEVLWPDQLIDNPYNMVKGVAFRVRKILDNICTHKLVVAKSGTYAINDSLTIILDTDTFDKLCDRVHASKLTDIEKQQMYDRAIRIYKGDMLPNYESEIWLLGWVGYYQIKYLEILKEYLALLQETAQYGKIFEVVSNVMSIGYEDGEIYEVLIDALVRQNRFELAKSYYMRVEKLLSPDRQRHFIDFWNEYKK